MNEPSIPVKLKLLISIVNRGQGEKVAEVCMQEHVHYHFICHGVGTASSEILDYLGIGESDKDIVMTIIPASRSARLEKLVFDKLQMRWPGRGILFSIRMNGVSGLISHSLSQYPDKIESEVRKLDQSPKYDLIVSIINHGETDKVMTAAKSAGATGGTVIHARGLGSKEAQEFLGISIQPEKEIVWIVVERESKLDVMQAINKAAGLRTQAHGILFSLPVDSLMGIEM